MNKTATALGGLTLLLAAMAPSAFAHDDSGPHGIPDIGDISSDRDNSPGTGSNANMVSGWYVGSASALLAVVNVPPTGNGNCAEIPDDALQESCEALLGGGDFWAGSVLPCLFYLNQPLCEADKVPFVNWPTPWCDMEVSFPGSTINDEEVVDGSYDGPGVAENLFNDGGLGEICHTPEGFYDPLEDRDHNGYSDFDYDTGGCNYGNAIGQDLVSPVLWGSTGCDWLTAGSTGGLVNHVLALEWCTVKAMRTANLPEGTEDLVTREAGCVDNFVECVNDGLRNLTGGQVPPVDALGNQLETATDNLLNGLSGGPDDIEPDEWPIPGGDCPHGAWACGADGGMDHGAFGDLSGDNDPATPGVQGVGFPWPHWLYEDCDANGYAAVFIWNAVVVDAYSPPGPGVGVATYGWVAGQN